MGDPRQRGWTEEFRREAVRLLLMSGRTVGEVAADLGVGWQHVNLTGDYLWRADDGVGPDRLRPLRGAATNAKQALAG